MSASHSNPTDPPAYDVTVVRASGDLDAASAARFRGVVEQATRDGASLVLVDMARVGFLDSAGMAALVGLHRQLPPGQRLALANVPARMQRVLRMSGVGTLFQVHEQGQPWPWPAALAPCDTDAEGGPPTG